VTPNEILSRVLLDIREHRSCAVIFDLDSTLFCVSPRSEAILRELATADWFHSRFPEAAKVLAKVEIQPTEYGIKPALLRAGLAPSNELIETVRRFWRERFFSNSHMRHDLIYPGADVFVRRVHDAGADVYYLTGRNETLMREGTMSNLKTWKFPNLPFERIMMKPSDLDSDENFKELRLKEMTPRYDRLWLFENEPVIIHQLRKSLPQLRIVFMDSAHSGKADPPKDLLTLRMDFRIPPEGD
jgi:hypothetical protein